jgi:hypothetical protein
VKLAARTRENNLPRRLAQLGKEIEAAVIAAAGDALGRAEITLRRQFLSSRTRCSTSAKRAVMQR